MTQAFAKPDQQTIRMAIARDAYARDEVRIVEPVFAGHPWLVATSKGVFAVGPGGATALIRGWFFGMCRTEDALYLFENCALRERAWPLGRIVRIAMRDGALGEASILTKGLDASCHQLAMIDSLLCLVDTAQQVIRRYAPDGTPIDVKAPLPIAPPDDRSGAYVHLNALARVHGRLALMLHNGAAEPERPSELVWLGNDWAVIERVVLPGHHCHDIVADDAGVIWHCASATGELIASDGRRVQLSADRMTRGLAFCGERIAVGLSSFGPRQNRDALPGAVALLDHDFRVQATIELDGPPATIIAL